MGVVGKGEFSSLDKKMIRSIWELGRLGAANHLGLDAEIAGYGDDIIGNRWFAVGLQAVPHVVDTVHFLVARATRFLNCPKHGRNRHEVVLQVFYGGAEAKTFGLPASRAMHESFHLIPPLRQDGLDQRYVASRGAKKGLSHGEVGVRQDVVHLVGTAVGEFLGRLGIASFGVLFLVDRGQQIMPGTCQSVAAYAAVFSFFMNRLP